MKKGNLVFTSIIFILVIIIFSIVSMVMYQSFTDIKDDVLVDLGINESKNTVNNVYDRYPSLFDGLILIIFVGLWILGIVAGLSRDEHPLLFGFMMFTIAFILIAGALLSNSYEEMFEDSDLSSMPATFPVTHWIITHLVQLGIMMAVSALLAVMAKNRL